MDFDDSCYFDLYFHIVYFDFEMSGIGIFIMSWIQLSVVIIITN